MSFGGGSQYTLEYLIKVTGQGGTAGISQVNSGLKQVSQNVNNVSMSQQNLQVIQDKISASSNRVSQAQQGVTKAMKGLAFGVLGITTAGAEFVGMLGMWQDTQRGVQEATEAQSKALKEGGKESKAYKDATMDLGKANRWAQMTFRNLMLSSFDMVPFFILTINGIVKLRNAYKLLREAQLGQKAIQTVLKTSNIGLAESNLIANTSYAKLTATQRLQKAEQQLGIRSNQSLMGSNTALTGSNTTLAASNKAVNGSYVTASNGAKVLSTANKGLAASNLSVNGSLITQIPLLSKTRLGMQGLATSTNVANAATVGLTRSMRILKAATVVLLPLIALEVVSQAIANNWGGFRDWIASVKIQLERMGPEVKTVTDLVWKLGESVTAVMTGDIGKLGKIWSGNMQNAEDATKQLTDAQKEQLEALENLNKESADFVVSLTEMDKKELGKALADLGLKGGIEKRVKDVIDSIGTLHEKFGNFQNSMETVRELDIWKGFGLKGVPEEMEKVYYKWEYTFGKLKKRFEKNSIGKEVFSGLEKTLKEAAKNPSEGPEIIAKYLTGDKEIMAFLESRFPEIAAWAHTIINEAVDKELAKNPDTVFDDPTIDVEKLGLGKDTRVNKLEQEKSNMDKILDEWRLSAGTRATQIGEAVWKGINDIWAVASIGVSPLISWFDKNIWTPLITFLTPAYNQGKAVADQVWIGLNEIWTLAIESPVGKWVIANIINPLITQLEGVYNAGANLASRAYAGLVDIWALEVESPAGKWVQEHILDPLQDPDLLKNLYETGKAAAWEVLKGITDILGPISNLIGPGLGDIVKLGKILEAQKAEGATTGDMIDINPNTLSPEVRKALGITDELSKARNPNSRFFQRSYTGLNRPKYAIGVDEFGNYVDPNGNIVGQYGANINIPGGTLPSGKYGPFAYGTGPEQRNEARSGWFFGAALGGSQKPLFSGGGFAESPIDNSLIAQQKGNLAMAGTFKELIAAAAAASKGIQTEFSSMFTALQGIFLGIATEWSKEMNSMGPNSASGSKQVQTEFSNMFTASQEMFMGLASEWSKDMNSMGSNSESAGKQIRSAFAKALQDVYDTMKDLASQWSKFCNSMGANARSAAKQINDALSKIKDVDVTVRVGVSGSGKSFIVGGGGIIKQLGSGGIISAASGYPKEFTTNGPQLMVVGDNPGGHEDITVVPRNNPGPTVDRINKRYGYSSGEGSTFNQNITLNISGNDIINPIKLKRNIRMTVGENTDRFGG